MNKERRTNNTLNYFTSCAVAFMALTLLPGKSYGAAESIAMGSSPDDAYPSVMTISGQGEVGGRPTRAEIQAAVLTNDVSASDAINSNSQRMEEVLSALEALGVAQDDVETSMLNLSSYRVRKDDHSEEEVRYRASHNITVLVRSLDKAGEILGGMINAGVNQLSGIEFKVDNPTELLDRALKLAVADARRKAELYAEALGVEIAHFLSLSEVRSNRGRRYMDLSTTPTEIGGNIPVVAPGQVTYDAGVIVKYTTTQ